MVSTLSTGAVWACGLAIEASAIEKTRERERDERIDTLVTWLMSQPCAEVARSEAIAMLDEPTRYRRDELIWHIEQSRARCVIDDRYVTDFLDSFTRNGQVNSGYAVTLFESSERGCSHCNYSPGTPCLVAKTRLPRPTTREERRRVETQQVCLFYASERTR